LNFCYEGKGEDIDIKFDGELIQWYGSAQDNNNNLIMEGGYSTTNTISEQRRRNRELSKELDELKETMKVLEKNSVDNSLALGKVVAYENVLLGRDLILPKPKYDIK